MPHSDPSGWLFRPFVQFAAMLRRGISGHSTNNGASRAISSDELDSSAERTETLGEIERRRRELGALDLEIRKNKPEARYSLDAMYRAVVEAKNGEPLTDSEKARIRGQHERMEAARTELDAVLMQKRAIVQGRLDAMVERLALLDQLDRLREEKRRLEELEQAESALHEYEVRHGLTPDAAEIVRVITAIELANEQLMAQDGIDPNSDAWQQYWTLEGMERALKLSKGGAPITDMEFAAIRRVHARLSEGPRDEPHEAAAPADG